MKIVKNIQGFSLLELILVLAVLIILGTALFFWIDPVEQVNKAEDKRRQQDVLTIANAFADYSRDHKGTLPVLGQVDTNKKVLCTNQSGGQLACGASTQYCLKIDDQEFFDKYLGKLPLDPDKTSDQDTGYYITEDANHNITFGACNSNLTAVEYKARLKNICNIYGGGYCWYMLESDVMNCNQVCAFFGVAGLTCVEGATYGPDKDYLNNNFCMLNKSFDAGYCDDTCVTLGDNTPPYVSDDYISCYLEDSATNGPIDCSSAAEPSRFNICPCQ